MKKPSKKSGPTEKRNTGSDGELERGGSRSRQRKYVLRLYVSGSTEKSTQAVENVKRVCEEHLKNHYDLEVIDIYQQPQLARGEQIVAVPTLIKRLPLPQRSVGGASACLRFHHPKVGLMDGLGDRLVPRRPE